MRALLIDLVGLTGYGSLLWGLWQVYEPAAPIAGGVIGMTWAVYASRPPREVEG